MRQRFGFLNEAVAADAGGAVGGTDAGVEAQPAADTTAPQAVEGGATDSVLNSGAEPIAIPEKYQVKREDGTLDMEATSKKLAEGYAHLEKRVGSGDLPPKSADDYQIAIPEPLQAHMTADDAMLSEFKAEALKAGLTQAQMDFVMGKYFDIAPQLVSGGRELSAEDCTAELRNEWKTDEQFKAEVGKAFKAVNIYGGSDAESLIKDYGNDPRIVRLLSRIGNELGEDSPIGNVAQQTTGGSVEALMQSDAYLNPKHPEHKAVSLKVQKYFENQAAANERAGNIAVL